MSKTTYEEYLKRYGSLTYKNTGTSMLPLLKQGRDAFIVRAVGEYETCKKWDVVLYKRPPESYVLHRVVRVLGNSYDILGDNCIGIERNIPKDAVIGVMTGFIRNGKQLLLRQHAGTISRLRLIAVYGQVFANLRAVIMEGTLSSV